MRDLIAQGTRVQMCVTSPPYWGLRDYGTAGQLGLESTPQEYVANMVEVFRLVRELLADDGVLWCNLGDSWSDKQLMGIPWRLAFALQADGWYLRQDIIWSKPNPMPESVTDRCTKAHEYLFLLSKRATYYYDAAAIAEDRVATHAEYQFGGLKYIDDGTHPGNQGHQYAAAPRVPKEYRNRRSVWTVTTQPYGEAHFATFPPALIEPCILAGSRTGDVVFDPFMGSGTTGEVAQRLGRQWLGCELNPAYEKLQKNRTAQLSLMLA
jgi:DNA modification methylase